MAFFNKEIDYAVQLMAALKNYGEEQPLSLKEFARRSSFSFLFLQRIAKKLREAELVRARLGNRGGYWLARNAAGITLADIIEAVAGPIAMVPCMKGTQHCRHASICLQRHKFFSLNQEIKKFFGQKTLAQL